MQTCMSCSERKWREKERRRWGETQRERSPSPSAVMDYTSPFLPHTLPPPLSKVGVCKPGVCHITSTALTHVVLEVCMCVEGGVAVVVHCDAEWEPSRKYCVCVCVCVWQFDGLTYLKMKGLVLTVGFIILGGKETNTTYSDKMTDSFHKCIFRQLRNKSPWLANWQHIYWLNAFFKKTTIVQLS